MNIKKIVNAGLILSIIIAVACSGKKDDEHANHEAGKKEEWKEMDEFHMVMAETFHPFKDSANLEPVKSKARELYAAADKWASVPLPEKVDNEEVKTKLQKLKSDAEALTETVKTGDDKKIGEDLTRLHDEFHELQEAWYGEEGHKKH
jgi:hypothetical protein